MRRALERHLVDDDWLAQASAQGLTRAATYSWQNCAMHTLDVYRQLT